MKHAEQTIPPQETGRRTDFIEKKRFTEIAAAHQAFRVAAAKLLNINDWHEYAGPGSSRFCLCNNLGDEATGFAREGFYFNIDLPAPGSDAGDGLEWVMIEQIETAGDEQAAEEFLSMTVRPVPDPRKASPEVAHFFSEVSTSTFIVKRAGKTLTAGVHGRNESPNNRDVDLHDTIRNTAVALAARIGLAGPQWKKLVKGLLDA